MTFRPLRALPVLGLIFALFAGAAAALASGDIPHGPDFASTDPVLDLGSALSPYHAANGVETDGSRWYMMTAVNESVRPVTRILLADQPYDSALRVFPRRGRAAIRQVATSDADVSIENAHAYGRYAFSVTIPPATTAELAVRVSNAAARPRVSAWLEPALAAHNRQLAILFAAVAGLIAAALAIMIGLSAMTGHAAPRWAAAVLCGVLLVRLAAAGLFDAVGVAGVGGPYGVTAMFAGLTLAAGLRLLDTIAPVDTLPPPLTLRHLTIGLIVLSAASLVGVPGMMLVTDIAVVIGTALVASHLVRHGHAGAQAARVAAPSATVFALVTTAAAVSALGGFQSDPAAPGIIGGFAGVGAVLLALAVAAGEGIAILPASRATAAPLPSSRKRSSEASRTVIAAIGASYQGVFEIDIAKRTVKLSREAAALLGREDGSETLSDTAWLDLLHPEDRAVYRDAIDRFCAQKGLAFRVEFRARTARGDYCWLELRASTLGRGEMADRCLGLIADVTMRKEAEAQARARECDSLTGLRNRIGLVEELERLGERIASATLVLLDLDRFKSIHESLGDHGGDSILAGAAGRLRAFARNAAAFRFVGDSFAILFPHTDSNALAIGERVVTVLAEPHRWRDRSVYAPASVGVALGRDAGDPLDLIRKAELALRKAKRDGGACARLYSRALEKSAPADTVALDSALRQAIAKGHMTVVYQPVLRVADRSVAGFETLLRWNSPERGTVRPRDFISHAERTGFIVELGRFALSCAAADLAAWQKLFPRDPPLFASVNVSRRQLKGRQFETNLARIIAGAGVDPGTLKLELTESAAGSPDDLLETLRRLRGYGASLALDDFGTGLSTLAMLHEAPFDTVKVDRSFLVRTRDGAADGEVVLRSIVALAHELRRVVVLEGVENETDLAIVARAGCDFVQGYYFAGPLAPSEVPAFLAANLGGKTSVSAVSGVTDVGGEA
ncbi:MAG: putative bifunctional diguanylate cyclase/phosphodiesterase [Rhizomicrobium sp.]